MASFYLPLDNDPKTKQVLKKAASAHRFLAELKGMADTIPNESILISTLTLQEAKDSCALAIVFLKSSKENFTEILAFAGTLIGSVTGYYFGGKTKLQG